MAGETADQLIAPATAENITDDGGVKKVVLEPSDGELPTRHARCLVHYVARLADTGEEFFNTQTETESREPKEVIAGRASSLHETGLNLGVGTMRVGEKARLYVTPKYGYGERGNFSFPTVPPNASLVYDVHLLACGQVEEKPVSSMLFEERLEAAERKRLQGNTTFQEGKYEEALGQYVMALSYMNEDFMYQLEGIFLDKANAVRFPVLLNMAAVKMKQENYTDASACCTEVLNHDPSNLKALFRRGKCRRVLGQTEAAQQDLIKAQEMAPEDKSILKELQEVERAKKAEAQAEKKLFAGKFKKGGLNLYEEDESPAAPQSDAPQQSTPQSRSFLFKLLSSLWQWVQSLLFGKKAVST